jgi:hypothetical protein
MTCVLIDCCDGLATRQTIVLSADHLRETLAGYADREPGVLRLEGLAGMLVRIGCGGPVGVVLVTGGGATKDEQIAVAPTQHTQGAVAFRYLGEQVPFAPQLLLPAAAAVDIVVLPLPHEGIAQLGPVGEAFGLCVSKVMRSAHQSLHAELPPAGPDP